MFFKVAISWILLTLIVSGGSIENECCPNSFWIRKSNCSDGSEIKLSCPDGKYKLDQSDTELNFTIIKENGLWLATPPDLDAKFRIPQNEFCLSKKKNQSDDLLIALVCFSNSKEQTETEAKIRQRFILNGILSILSSCFLFITLAVYVILPDLREIQDKATMSVVVSMLVSFLITAIQALFPNFPQMSDGMCETFAFAMYYSFLATFFWLNLVAFNIWRIVWLKNFKWRGNRLFGIFCAIGWGIPLFFLIATMFYHFEHKRIVAIHSCWFEDHTEELFYFRGPISILLMMNLIYLSLTCWRLWYSDQDCDGNKLKKLRCKFHLYVKLIFVTGMTWIFEIISFFDKDNGDAWYWISIDILNGLQGVVIFIVFVVSRMRVRKLLAEKRPFGINFPGSWRDYEDLEYDERENSQTEQAEMKP